MARFHHRNITVIMANRDVTQKAPLESLEVIPIAKLNPDIPNPESLAVRAVVTLTWPYNSIKTSIAFCLAEHDFQLRRDHGQVRVQFDGPAAAALSDLDVGSGDEALIGLQGVEWSMEQQNRRKSASNIQWQMNFKNVLRIQLILGDDRIEKTIDVDTTSRTELPAVESSLSPFNDYPEREITPRTPILMKPAQNHVSRPALDSLDVYQSPAYLKRQRLSYGSLFEDPWDEENIIPQRNCKRTRFGRESTSWRYTSQSPTPEAESKPEPKPESKSECHQKPELAAMSTCSAILESKTETVHRFEPSRSHIEHRSEHGNKHQHQQSTGLSQNKLIPESEANHMPCPQIETKAKPEVDPESKQKPASEVNDQIKERPKANNEMEDILKQAPQQEKSDDLVTGAQRAEEIEETRRPLSEAASVSVDEPANLDVALTRSHSPMHEANRHPIDPNLFSPTHEAAPVPRIFCSQATSMVPHDILMNIAEDPSKNGSSQDQMIVNMITNQDVQIIDAHAPLPLSVSHSENHPPDIRLQDGDTTSSSKPISQYTQTHPRGVYTDYHMQDQYSLETLEHKSPSHPQPETSTITDLAIPESYPHEPLQTHSFHQSHNAIIEPHDVDNSHGIKWAIASEPSGPEPLANQLDNVLAVEACRDGAITILEDAREKSGSYNPVTKSNRLLENRAFTSKAVEPTDGDNSPEDQSDESDDNGDYFARNYADVQDEGSTAEVETVDSNQYYDEEEEDRYGEESYIVRSPNQDSFYKDENEQGDEYESEENDTHAYVSVHSFPPPRSGSAEVIDLISDSDSDGEEEDQIIDSTEIISEEPRSDAPIPSLISQASSHSPNRMLEDTELGDAGLVRNDAKIYQSDIQDEKNIAALESPKNIITTSDSKDKVTENEVTEDIDQEGRANMHPSKETNNEENVYLSGNNISMQEESIFQGSDFLDEFTSKKTDSMISNKAQESSPLVSGFRSVNTAKFASRTNFIERNLDGEASKYEIGINAKQESPVSEGSFVSGSVTGVSHPIPLVVEEHENSAVPSTQTQKARQGSLEVIEVGSGNESILQKDEVAPGDHATGDKLDSIMTQDGTPEQKREEIALQINQAMEDKPTPILTQEEASKQKKEEAAPKIIQAIKDKTTPVLSQEEACQTTNANASRISPNFESSHHSIHGGQKTSEKVIVTTLAEPTIATRHSPALLSQPSTNEDRHVLAQMEVDGQVESPGAQIFREFEAREALISQTIRTDTVVKSPQPTLASHGYFSTSKNLKTENASFKTQPTSSFSLSEPGHQLDNTGLDEQSQLQELAKKSKTAARRKRQRRESVSESTTGAVLYDTNQHIDDTDGKISKYFEAEETQHATIIASRQASPELGSAPTTQPSFEVFPAQLTRKRKRRGTDSSVATNSVSEKNDHSPVASTRAKRRGRPPNKPKLEPLPLDPGTDMAAPPALSTRRAARQAQLRAAGSPISPPTHDSSIRLAKAALAERRGSRNSNPSFESVRSPRTTRSSFRRSKTPESLAAQAVTSSSTPAVQDRSIEIARAALRSPSRASASFGSSDPDGSTDRTALEKTLKQELAEYRPLKGFKKFVNNSRFKTIVVAVTASSEPHRPKGSREYAMTFMVTDHSIALSATSNNGSSGSSNQTAQAVVEVQMFHRMREHLPTVRPGDGVLLRYLTVAAIKDKGYGLRSHIESQVAVFETDRELAQIRDGLVEVSDMEARWARRQMAWYAALGEKARDKVRKGLEKVTKTER